MTDTKAGSPPSRESRPRPKRSKAAPRKPQPATPPDDEWANLTQREKFIRTAQELGCDETGEALDEALRTVGRGARRR